MPNIFLKDREGDKEKLKKILRDCQKIYLELAAGRGEYTLYLAEKDKSATCLAVDFRSDRLLWGAKRALEKNLSNAIFLRERVEELPNYLKPHSVDKIWLPFPDPFPKDKHEKHRLTNEKYLLLYKNLLKKDGKIFFKTDNRQFFEYTLQKLKEANSKIIKISQNLLQEKEEELTLPTRYQTQAINGGRKIHLIIFKP